MTWSDVTSYKLQNKCHKYALLYWVPVLMIFRVIFDRTVTKFSIGRSLNKLRNYKLTRSDQRFQTSAENSAATWRTQPNRLERLLTVFVYVSVSDWGIVDPDYKPDRRNNSIGWSLCHFPPLRKISSHFKKWICCLEQSPGSFSWISLSKFMLLYCLYCIVCVSVAYGRRYVHV